MIWLDCDVPAEAAENVSVAGLDSCGSCGDAMVMTESCSTFPHRCDFRNGCEP